MPSPQCTVDGNATTDGVDVAANATVTIQLADLAGVGPWLIQCVSTDDHQTASAVTAGLTINSITKTATFTSPNVTDGAALIFESKVNNGKDANGRVDLSLTTRFGIYVLTDPGSLRVGAFDETTEGSASYGWTSKVNHCIRAAASGGVTPTVSGTLPITVDNSNPANAVIGINAATTLAAGSMSSADKTKLDAANSNSTPSTIVMYKSDGGLCAMNVVGCTGDNLVLSSDGISSITMDGNGTGNVLIPAGIRAPFVWLDTAITGVIRSAPLDWRGYYVSGAESWIPTATGTCKQNVIDAEAECYVQLDIPHGSKIEYVIVRTKGAGAGPAPGNLPVYTVVRQNITTLAQTITGTATDAGGGSYRTTHVTQIDCSLHTVDRATYRYYLLVGPETGSDSVIGFQLDAVAVQLTFPVGYSLGLG